MCQKMIATGHFVLLFFYALCHKIITVYPVNQPDDDSIACTIMLLPKHCGQ